MRSVVIVAVVASLVGCSGPSGPSAKAGKPVASLRPQDLQDAYTNAVAGDQKYKGKTITLSFDYGGNSDSKLASDGGGYVLKINPFSGVAENNHAIECWLDPSASSAFAKLKGPAKLIGVVEGRKDDAAVEGGFKVVLRGCKLSP